MQILSCFDGLSSTASVRRAHVILRGYNANRRQYSEQTTNINDLETGHPSAQATGALETDHKPKLIRAERPLPLSPIVDPKAIRARTRWAAPKPASKGPPRSAFQARLLNNPYAQALASPVRLCSMTKARLPNYFLVDFDSIDHPETGKRWFYPEGFERESRKKLDTDTTNGAVIEQSVPTEKPLDKPIASKPEETNPNPQTLRSSRRRRVPGKGLARYSLYHQIGKLTRTKFRMARNIWATLLHSTARPASPAVVNQHVFREDMYDFLLDSIRLRVVKELEVIHDRGKEYMTFVDGEQLEQGPALAQAGAILRFGRKDNAAPEADQSQYNLSTVSKTRLAAMDVEVLSVVMKNGRSKYTVVYDLPELLGEKHMEQLQEVLGHKNGVQYALLKNKRATVDVRAWLWKLHGYLHT